MSKQPKNSKRAPAAIEDARKAEIKKEVKAKRLRRLLSGQVNAESFDMIANAFEAEPVVVSIPIDKAKELYSRLVVTAFGRGLDRKKIRELTAKCGFSVSAADINTALADALKCGVEGNTKEIESENCAVRVDSALIPIGEANCATAAMPILVSNASKVAIVQSTQTPPSEGGPLSAAAEPSPPKESGQSNRQRAVFPGLRRPNEVLAGSLRGAPAPLATVNMPLATSQTPNEKKHLGPVVNQPKGFELDVFVDDSEEREFEAWTTRTDNLRSTNVP